MNMMAPSRRIEGSTEASGSAHAAAVRAVPLDSPYGKYFSAVTKHIRDVEAMLGQSELSDRKTPVTLLTEEEARLSTKLIQLEVTGQSRGTFVDLVPFRPEYANLVSDLEVLERNGNLNASRPLKELRSWKEIIDYWAGLEV